MTPDAAVRLAATLALEREIMDECAPEYRRWTLTGSLVYREERAAFVRWLLADLRRTGHDPADLRFLDVGCGTGEALEELHAAGARHLAGLDLSPAMLAEARRHVGAAGLVRGILEQHPFLPGTVDVVTAIFTVHHLVDPRAFFALAADVLAPGGVVFVMDYNRTSWSRHGPLRHVVRLLAAPLRFALRAKNRRSIAAQPALRSRFNPAHRLLDLSELAAAADAAGFASTVTTRGLFLPWLLHDVVPESRVDRGLVAAVGRLDQAVCPPSARSYQWLAARRPGLAADRSGLAARWS